MVYFGTNGKKNKPYHVFEMDRTNFFDLKFLAQEITLNWDRDENNEKLYLNKIRIIEANHNFPNKILFKYDYQEEFKRIDLLHKGRKKLAVDINKIEMKQCHKEILPVTRKKYDHLQFLCNKKVIPVQYHHFYSNLPYSLSNKDDDSE